MNDYDKVDELLTELEETADQIIMEAEEENPNDMMALMLANNVSSMALTTRTDRRMKNE